MRTRIRAALASPQFLLALTAAFLSLAVQSGELGSADTMHRLQTAHSFWTSEPPVFPNEYPEFGIYGRGGKLYDWYGIGQPLLLLPFDIAGTYIEKLPAFAAYKGNDPTVRNIFVSGAVNTLISILTALVCFRFLLALEFDTREAVAGVLALVFCTTHLHYTQNMMENNYIFLLTLTGLLFQHQWLRTGRTRDLLLGSASLGLNLLTRLTTALDIMAVGLFLLLVVWSSEGKQAIWLRLFSYVKTAFPVYFVFFCIDRLYQFHRFGSWTDTYVRYFALKYHALDATLPPNYPWETPFHVGFFGALFSREKSIFLFDPLLVLTIAIAVFCWKRLTPQLKSYIAVTFSLVLAYICLYARYTVWNGNFAWGDRYVSSAAQMAAFISVPILLKHRSDLNQFIWKFGWVVVLTSLVIQISSLMFWLPLEIYQADDFGHPQWIIWLRLKNIVAFALGKTEAWGLVTDSMGYDQWDFQHITAWNFLPFLLRRIGEAPKWMVGGAFALWIGEHILLALTLRKLWNTALSVLKPEAKLPRHSRCAILKSVDHTCPQCHSAVADSAAFCENCGSPQIRFSPHEVSTVPILISAGVPHSITVADLPPQTITQSPATMHRRAAFRSAMNAGIVAAVLSLVPLKPSFVFALPFAGFLSVLLYRRYSRVEDPSTAVGFRLGVWTGLTGFVILIGVIAVSTLGFHSENELRDGLIQAVHQAQSRYTDPQSREALEQFLTPGGLAALMILGSAFMCVFFAVLSGIGGAVSTALLRRKLPPQ